MAPDCWRYPHLEEFFSANVEHVETRSMTELEKNVYISVMLLGKSYAKTGKSFGVTTTTVIKIIQKIVLDTEQRRDTRLAWRNS